jgi:hypothetical protein
MKDQALENRFAVHSLSEDDATRCACVRAMIGEVASFVKNITPDSRELSLGITKLEEAMFWINAAIARS